jgi:hypothetical protein
MKRASSTVTVHTDDAGRIVLTVDGTEMVVADTIRRARGSAFSPEETAAIEALYAEAEWW